MANVLTMKYHFLMISRNYEKILRRSIGKSRGVQWSPRSIASWHPASYHSQNYGSLMERRTRKSQERADILFVITLQIISFALCINGVALQEISLNASDAYNTDVKFNSIICLYLSSVTFKISLHNLWALETVNVGRHSLYVPRRIHVVKSFEQLAQS